MNEANLSEITKIDAKIFRYDPRSAWSFSVKCPDFHKPFALHVSLRDADSPTQVPSWLEELLPRLCSHLAKEFRDNDESPHGHEYDQISELKLHLLNFRLELNSLEPYDIFGVWAEAVDSDRIYWAMHFDLSDYNKFSTEIFHDCWDGTWEADGCYSVLPDDPLWQSGLIDCLPSHFQDAEKGCVKTQLLLADKFATGDGVPEDEFLAEKWLIAAGEHEYAESEFEVRAFKSTFGTTEESVEAISWFIRAAEQGDERARRHIEALEKNAESQFKIGLAYGNFNDFPKYKVEAARWFRKAAKQGFAPAQRHLGFAYEHGNGVQQSKAEAVRWYRMAASHGDEKAHEMLGVMYASGRGVPKNYVEAVKHFRIAAKAGFVVSFRSLGVAYENGFGVFRRSCRSCEMVSFSSDTRE